MIFGQRLDKGKDAERNGASGAILGSLEIGNWILLLMMGVE
jgi:hypothetical protein